MIPSIGLSQIILKQDNVIYHCYTNRENRILGVTILEKLQQDTIIDLYKTHLVIKDSIINFQYITINQQDTIIQKQSKEILRSVKDTKKLKYYRYTTWTLALTTLIFILL